MQNNVKTRESRLK